MVRQLDALLPGRRAVLIGLEARAPCLSPTPEPHAPRRTRLHAPAPPVPPAPPTSRLRVSPAPPCTLDLQARADLNGRHCTVLEPSSDGRFPTRVDGVVAAANRDDTLEALGEELDACLRGGEGGTEGGTRRSEEPRGQPPEGELVRVRPRNLWPSSK